MAVTAAECGLISRRRQRGLYPRPSCWGFGGTPEIEGKTGPRFTLILESLDFLWVVEKRRT